VLAVQGSEISALREACMLTEESQSSSSSSSGVGSKRKRGDTAENQAAYDSFDWKAAADQGTLAKYTIDMLKVYARKHGLLMSGRKNDLLERVEKHIRAGG
jgi:hypothetical protein